MNRIALVAAFAGVTLAASPALAASPRTFVSGKGTDSGTCAVSTPCRSFAYAITQTAAGGEILVLDSAGYGPVTITQAVSIVAPPGIEGAITASSGNGITINAGPYDNVTLKGLSIDGARSGDQGIGFYSGSVLEIVDCTIQHFIGSGIILYPSTKSFITVTHTNSSFNSSNGIYVNATQGVAVKGFIKNSTTNGEGVGIYLIGQQDTSIVDSVSLYNNIGVSVGATGYTSVMRTSRSVFTANNTGVNVMSPATAFSYGDNKIDGNTTTDVSGSLTSLANR